MRRAELVEFHDLPWFPKVWRDMLTAYLTYISCEWGAYHPILPKLRTALERGNSQSIIDLCSGASGPLIKLRRYICREDGTQMPILLTDKYPNHEAFEKVAAASQGALTYEAVSVDAMDVPAAMTGFRTVFSAFHHFNPDQAMRILQDAVDKRAGIGVFVHRTQPPLDPAGPLFAHPLLETGALCPEAPELGKALLDLLLAAAGALLLLGFPGLLHENLYGTRTPGHDGSHSYG